MLEALLNHFRSYGMDDLEFIIVNSKLSHSQDKLHELQKRVSFSVYQETDDEEVWSVMQGGKDDMYVYDRCGRLTYFIPFPLSILNESPLVSNAILATYFRSPCGANCDETRQIGIDEFVKNMESNFEESNTTEQENVVFVGTEEYIPENGTSNETVNSNDLFAVIDSGTDFDVSNSSDFNITDYDPSAYNVSSHLDETNDTSVNKAKSFFHSIYKVFLKTGKNNETFEDTNSNSTLDNNTLNNDTNPQSKPSDEVRHGHHSHHKHPHKVKIEQRDRKKSDRCLEADYEVCKNWSKKRLLHAQKCCSETLTDLRDRRNCANFGKKRCKKIQSILKCCIKTVYTEPTTTTMVAEESTTTASQQEVSNVVCCKTTDEGKLCRVLTSGDCEKDEERNPSQTK